MHRPRRSAIAAVATALAAVGVLAACGNPGLRAGTLGGDAATTATTPASTPVPTTEPATDTAPPDSLVDEPEPSAADAPADTTAETTADTVASTTSVAIGPMQPSAADCPDTERGAVVYRPIQRAILCENGAISYVFPVTTGRVVPKPGEFVVSSRNTWVRSTVGGHVSTMTNFVAFTKQSPRIAFHSVPKTLDGKWVQPLSSVGSLKKWGASSGCIRVLPEDSKRVWNFLRNGDKVRIID